MGGRGITRMLARFLGTKVDEFIELWRLASAELLTIFPI